MKKFAIIVAGGSGKRMGAALPKQFLLLQKKPIIIHSIEKFVGLTDEIIVVLPSQEIDYFKQLIIDYPVNATIKIVEGGKERFHSVQNGLALLANEEGLVAIHDAVRPLIGQSVISKAYEAAKQHSSCVVAVASKDSIRQVKNGSNFAVPRNEYYIIQTPQIFDLELLKASYHTEYTNFTDDASVFEAAGNSIYLLEGEYSNIKITTPEDLFLAEALLKMNH